MTLLPAASYLTSSSTRLDSSESAITKFLSGLFSTYTMDANIETTGRLISNNTFCINQLEHATGWGNYYEMPNVCLTVFIFIFLGQFLVRKIRECKNTKQLVYGIFVTMVGVFILYNPGFAIAFNGFAYVQARYTFCNHAGSSIAGSNRMGKSDCKKKNQYFLDWHWGWRQVLECCYRPVRERLVK